MFFLKNKNKINNPLARGERRLSVPKKNFTIGKFFYWVALLAFIGVTIYALFFSHFLAITKIIIDGTEKIETASIEKEITSIIAGNYLNFLPKNNIILLKKERLGMILSENFKLIESLKIKKYFPNTLTVLIKEKNPRLILRVSGQDYVIDDKGIAYEKTDFESDFLRENQLPILEDTGGRKISVKNEALRPDYVQFILDVKDNLKIDLAIDTGQVMKTPNIASGDVALETNEGWRIYLNSSVGAEKELEVLKVILDNKIEKGKRGELEYIDLRTNNKVYYKFKQLANEEPVISE